MKDQRATIFLCISLLFYVFVYLIMTFFLSKKRSKLEFSYCCMMDNYQIVFFNYLFYNAYLNQKAHPVFSKM